MITEGIPSEEIVKSDLKFGSFARAFYGTMFDMKINILRNLAQF